jgi:AraC-type DNA-binding domain-containing proteins
MLHDLFIVSLTLPACCALLLCVQMWLTCGRSKSRKILASIFSLLAAFLIYSIIDFLHTREAMQMLDFTYCLLSIALAYLWFIYFRLLITPQQSNKRLLIGLYFTVGGYLVLMFCVGIVQPEPLVLKNISDIPASLGNLKLWIVLAGFIHFMALVLWFGIRLIALYRQHQRNIADRFSYVEQINLWWLPWFIGVCAVYGIGTVFDLFVAGNISYPFIFSNMVYAVIIVLMGLMGLSQGDIYSPQETAGNPQEGDVQQSNGQSTVAIKARKKLKTGLLDLMERECPYLKPDLRIDWFVQKLQTNRTYLSAIIHDDFGENFIGFVNRYRIVEAQRLMVEHPNEKLVAVAEKAGFKSVSSFNDFFRRLTGQSPAEYRRKQQAASEENDTQQA